MRSLKERENQIELRHAGIHASKEKYLVGAPVLTKMDEFSEILIADKTENVEQKVLKKSAAYFPKKGGAKGRSEFLRKFIHFCGDGRPLAPLVQTGLLLLYFTWPSGLGWAESRALEISRDGQNSLLANDFTSKPRFWFSESKLLSKTPTERSLAVNDLYLFLTLMKYLAKCDVLK